MVVTKEILESHPVLVLKKEISKTNIKGYSKDKKVDIIKKMLLDENIDKFSHIKMAEKKERKKPVKNKEKKKPNIKFVVEEKKEKKKPRKPRKLTIKGRDKAFEKLDLAHQRSMEKNPADKAEHDRILNEGYKAIIKKQKENR